MGTLPRTKFARCLILAGAWHVLGWATALLSSPRCYPSAPRTAATYLGMILSAHGLPG